MPLGDAVERALKLVGITPERVEQFLGAPCNCRWRQERMNQIHQWTKRILAGKTDDAAKYLDGIIGDGNGDGAQNGSFGGGPPGRQVEGVTARPG